MLKTVVLLNYYFFLKTIIHFRGFFEEIESSKEQHLKQNITVKFDNLNASILNKCIHFFQKIADFGKVDYVI